MTVTMAKARALCDMLCAQVHTSYSSAPGNPTLIAAGLAYLNPLGPHTGLDTLRDDTTGNVSVLEGFGTKLDIYAAYSSPGSNTAAFLGTMKSLVATGKVVLLEGPLEVDNQGWGMAVTNGCSYVGLDGATHTGWAAAIAMQKDIWTTFNGQVPIATFSLAVPGNGAAGGPAAGALPYANVSNTHFYPSGGKCVSDESSGYGLRGVIAYETGYCPNLPKAVTETGFNDNTTNFSEGYGTDAVNAKYLLNAICVGYSLGLVLMSLYELLDGLTGDSNPESTWGLFTSSGTPKATATALRNFLTTIGDAGATAETYVPKAYAAAVSGLPSNGYVVQLQRSNGDNIVIVGIDATIYANGKLTAAPNYAVAVSLPVAANSNVYDPIVGTTPISSPTSSQVTLTLSDHPQVIVVPAGTPVDPPPTPTPSPDDTVITAPSTAAIIDASGNSWTITSGGQVAVNGTADTITTRVIELAYVNGAVWQENSSDLWWYETAPGSGWLPSGGTTTSPLPAPPVTPTITVTCPATLSVAAGSTTAVKGISISDTGISATAVLTALVFCNFGTLVIGKATAAPGATIVITDTIANINANLAALTYAVASAVTASADNISFTVSEGSTETSGNIAVALAAVGPPPVTPPPVTPPPATAIPSPEGTVIVAANQPLVDQSGNTYTLIDQGTSGGPRIGVMLAGTTTVVVDPTSWNVSRMLAFYDMIFQENTGGMWWYKSTPADPWEPAPGLTTESMVTLIMANLIAR